MKPLKGVLAFVLVVILLAGCAGQPAAPQTTEAPQAAAPTVDTVATQNAQQTVDAKAAADAEATKVFQQTADAQATKDAITQATGAAETEIAIQKGATVTAKRAENATATASVKATADAKEASFMTKVQRIYDEGYIGSTEGEFYTLDDFEEEQAQLNYFFPHALGYEAEAFVFSSDLMWESASENANWFASGCGVLYGMQGDSGSAILTYLGLDGLAHTLMGYHDGWPQVAVKRWGKPDLPKGEATLTISLWEKYAKVFVNDKLTSEYYTPLFRPGDLGLTVVSGTNKGFGTRCHFTNMALYILK